MKYVIFDGDCGICSFSANLIEKYKINDSIKTIPSFQFELEKYGIHKDTANVTVIFINDRRKQIYFRTRAIMEICKSLKFPFRIFGFIFANPLASFVFDPIYNIIAKNRAYISTKFGLNACKIR